MTGGDTGEKPQVWLQRALDAQFDHLPSFRSMMNGLLPSWAAATSKCSPSACPVPQRNASIQKCPTLSTASLSAV